MFNDGSAAARLEAHKECKADRRCAACLMVDELIEQLIRRQIREAGSATLPIDSAIESGAKVVSIPDERSAAPAHGPNSGAAGGAVESRVTSSPGTRIPASI
jgi:hypothetical protein